MGMLCCGACGQFKEVEEFYTDPRRATKRKRDCKVCMKAARKSADALKRDRERKAKKYADAKWRKEHNAKRKLARSSTKSMRAASSSHAA